MHEIRTKCLCAYTSGSVGLTGVLFYSVHATVQEDEYLEIPCDCLYRCHCRTAQCLKLLDYQ